MTNDDDDDDDPKLLEEEVLPLLHLNDTMTLEVLGKDPVGKLRDYL